MAYLSLHTLLGIVSRIHQQELSSFLSRSFAPSRLDDCGRIQLNNQYLSKLLPLYLLHFPLRISICSIFAVPSERQPFVSCLIGLNQIDHFLNILWSMFMNPYLQIFITKLKQLLSQHQIVQTVILPMNIFSFTPVR